MLSPSINTPDLSCPETKKSFFLSRFLKCFILRAHIRGDAMRALIVFLAISILFFQNCSGDKGFTSSEVGSQSVVGFDGQRDSDSNSSSGSNSNNGPNGNSGPSEPVVIEEPQTPPQPVPIEDIVRNCQTRPVETQVVQLSFPKPNQTCAWNQDGNLSKRNDYFQARIEQTQYLNLPEGSLICDATFAFEQQDFLYDDHFMLLFNDNVIAASYDWSEQFEQTSFGLLKYDWNRMAGMSWNTSKETIFCPNIPETMSSCQFPGHDQQGIINLAYSDTFIQALMAGGVPQNHHFKMVSIGDNDNYDCEHAEVNFAVTVKFVR